MSKGGWEAFQPKSVDSEHDYKSSDEKLEFIPKETPATAEKPAENKQESKMTSSAI